MKKNKQPIPGQFFCIPLFMDRTDWRLKTKLQDADFDGLFVFGRVIETSSSVLIEVFRKVGPTMTDLVEVEKSGVLFSPVQVFWDAIIKGRWRIVGCTTEYDKNLHSNYQSLKMVFGDASNFRLRDFSSGIEEVISREEIHKYEFSTVWFPIDLENRIVLSLGISS